MTKISAGWSHDTHHYSFYRQTPHWQRDIPFDQEPEASTAEIVFGSIAFLTVIALIGLLVSALAV
jgi:hypothetical protein